MKRVAVEGLPEDPLDAAGHFQRHCLPHIEEHLVNGEDVMLVVPSADHTHREWRIAMVTGLARKHTPRRINMVAGNGEAVDSTETYLAGAPGITGQYLET